MKTIFGKKTERFILSVKLASDKMKLFVDIDPASAGPLEEDEVRNLLVEAAPQADFHDAVLADILQCLRRGEKVTERRIAKGINPQPGADGKLLLLVKKFSTRGQAEIDERGKTKFTELNLFDNVEPGQIVARIYSPKAGSDGRNALGERIQASAGKPLKIAPDKSIELSQGPSTDYQIVKAKLAGYLQEEGGKLSIQPELVIAGDLDLRMGSLNFVGKVRVQGDVSKGLVIRAKLGIQVDGSAREATLISSDGDVTVLGFLFNGHNSKVLSGKNVNLSVVQNGDIEARRVITIEKESVDSRFFSQMALLAGRARIVGGVVNVVLGAEALIWGNAVGLKTEIHLCSELEATAEFSDLHHRLAQHDQALSMIELHLGPYAKNPTRLQYLKEPHRTKMEAMLNKRKQIELSRQQIVNKKAEMMGGARDNNDQRVNFGGSICPGVEVYAEGATFKVMDAIEGPGSLRFDKQASEFKVLELQPFDSANLIGES